METKVYVVEVLADSCMEDFGADSVWDTYAGAKAMFLELLGRDIEVIKESFINYKGEWPYEDYSTIEEYLQEAIDEEDYGVYNGDGYWTTRITSKKLNKVYK